MSETILLRRIRLKNILSHESTEVRLPIGLIAFVGPNGAGKSSIIDAVIYALFVLPSAAKGYRGEGKRGLIRSGASDGAIEVEMSIGGRVYIVQRYISVNRPDTAFIYEVAANGNKKVIAAGVQNVVSSIEKLLSIPSTEAVKFSIVSRQNELTRFIEENESKRKEIVLKLLGLEELEKAKEMLKEVLREVEKAKDVYEDRKRQLFEVSKRLEGIKSSIDLLRKRRIELENIYKELSKEVEDLERAKDALLRFERIKKAKDLLNEISIYKSLEDACKRILSVELGKIVSRLEIYRSSRKELEGVLKQLNELKLRLSELKLQALKILQVPFEEDSVEKLIDVIEKKIDELRELRQLKKAEIEISEKSIQIVKTSSICPVCRRPLDEELKKSLLSDVSIRIKSSRKLVEEYEAMESMLWGLLSSIKSLRDEMTRCGAKYDMLLQQMRRALEEHNNNKQLISKIVEDVKNFRELQECIEFNDFSLVKTLQCLQRKCIEYLNMLSDREVQLQKLLSELKIGGDAVLEEFSNLQYTLSKLGIAAEKLSIEELEQRYRESSKRLQMVRDELSKVEGKLEELEKSRIDLEKHIEELESELKKLEKDVIIFNALDVLTNSVLGKDGLIAKTLTKEARRLLELYANNILSEFGMDFRVSIDDDFGIEVWSPLGRLDLRGLSGGESIALAIALRLALAYTVFGRLPGFLMLDEPTQFLDEERRRALFDVIKRLSQRIPQVIVVTHDRDVIEIADHIFYVSKEGGRSIVREKSVIQKELLEL
uniref:AAA+ ATPase domain-containing protein n=1 Tax=Ignisphaera aggregans TaxID=334771 RepID=A0A7C4FD88_9CREN